MLHVRSRPWVVSGGLKIADSRGTRSSHQDVARSQGPHAPSNLGKGGINNNNSEDVESNVSERGVLGRILVSCAKGLAEHVRLWYMGPSPSRQRLPRL